MAGLLAWLCWGAAGAPPPAGAAWAQGGLLKSPGDLREDDPGEPIRAPAKPDCPYEKLRRVTTRCAACLPDADHVNSIRERITELNRQIAEIECERRLVDGGGVSIAEAEQCPDGRPLGSGTKYRFGFMYTGEAFGATGAGERTAARFGTGWGNISTWSYDLETFDSFDDMIDTIRAKVPAPVDRTGQCGNCISQLTVYQHGQIVDRRTAAGTVQQAAGVVAIGEVQIDGTATAQIDKATRRLRRDGRMGEFNRDTLSKLASLRPWLCEDATVSFITCEQASVDAGKLAGEVLATELGVPVMLPDFSVPFGTCPPSAGTQMSGWVQLDPKPEPPPTGPTPQELREQARQARLAALRRQKSSAETILSAAMARLLACENACLLSHDAQALGTLLESARPVVQVEQVHHRTGDNFFGPNYDPVREERQGGGSGGGTGGGVPGGGSGGGSGGSGGGSGGGGGNAFEPLQGPLSGNGGCGFNSTNLQTSGSNTSLSLPPNGNVSFPNSGAGNGESQSGNLIVFGLPGHRCAITFLNLPGAPALLLQCQNNVGGACVENFVQ